MSKCEKHDVSYEPRYMGQGKTLYVCPKCEAEQLEKISKLFVGVHERTPCIRKP